MYLLSSLVVPVKHRIHHVTTSDETQDLSLSTELIPHYIRTSYGIILSPQAAWKHQLDDQ